ncbi:MAG: hypothetical protein AAFO04_23550, partial [Cyanobacteria bacterium J06592_8]
QVGEDLIVLGNGVSFAELEIFQVETSVAVAVAGQLDQPFALLNGLTAESLTEASFISESLF